VCNVLAVQLPRRSHDQRRLRPEKRPGAGRQRPNRRCLRTDAPSRAGVSHEVRADGSKAGPHKAGLKGLVLDAYPGRNHNLRLPASQPLTSPPKVHAGGTISRIWSRSRRPDVFRLSTRPVDRPVDKSARSSAKQLQGGLATRCLQNRHTRSFLGAWRTGSPFAESRGQGQLQLGQTNTCRLSPGSSIGYLTPFVRRRY
jgi:hypothetical protein